MDEAALLPIWISAVLSYDVPVYAVEYLSGICRRKESQHGCHFGLDFQTSLALGLSRHPLFRRRRAIRLRLLQCHAHIHDTGISYNALMETALLVRILPDGNDDAAYMQGKGQEIIGSRPKIENRNSRLFLFS